MKTTKKDTVCLAMWGDTWGCGEWGAWWVEEEEAEAEEDEVEVEVEVVEVEDWERGEGIREGEAGVFRWAGCFWWLTAAFGGGEASFISFKK